MKAVVTTATSTDDPLQNLSVVDIPLPVLAREAVRLKITTSSLNHHDLWTLRGISSQPVRPMQVLGCDAVGVIAEYGQDALQPFPVGTRVLVYPMRSCGNCTACRYGEPEQCKSVGMLSEYPYQGTFAEYLDVPPHTLHALPDTVSDTQAACLPVAYLTAYRMLFDRGGVTPGSTVLVHGASGGVSTAAIVLAAAAGSSVMVTSKDADKCAFALSLGATAAVTPDREGLKQGLTALGTPEGVDVVIETVGEATWGLSMRAVRPHGTIVVSGATTGDNPPAGLTRVFWFQLTVSGSGGGSQRQLDHLIRMVATRKLDPVVDSVTSMTDINHAVEKLVQGKQRGKLVISIS